MFTIVGAGFGLYGYLPAIINVAREKVILADQYRPSIESRPELVGYMDSIEWLPSIRAALECASGAVIAIPPQAQEQLVDQALSIERFESLIIEKPVAPSPGEAFRLTEALEKKSKHFRVGYTFLYTNWYGELMRTLQLPAVGLRMTWSFKADHFSRNKETWKRYHSLGGGVLRFYGIHVIATLASLGYREAVGSMLEEVLPDQPALWSAQFIGVGVPRCEVHVSANADQNIFRIEALQLDGGIKVIHAGASPFAVPNPAGGQDGRVPVLERLIRSLEQDDGQYIKLYHSVNDLWESTEHALV